MNGTQPNPDDDDPQAPAFSKEDAKAVSELFASISKTLAGRPPALAGAALADATALWLAGHVVFGNPHASRKLRADLLRVHVRMIKALIPANAKAIGTDT